MKNRTAVAFTGPSNSGKTTLIEKVAKVLIKTEQVAIIKNDPKDKANFDVEGKDSYKFSQTGAEVVVTSSTRTTYFSQREKNLDDIIAMINRSSFMTLPYMLRIQLTISDGRMFCREAIVLTLSFLEICIPFAAKFSLTASTSFPNSLHTF